MSIKTPIEWADSTWSPVRFRVKQDAAQIAQAKGYASLVQIAEKMAGHVGPHCEHVSPGCEHCYSGTGNIRCLPSNGTGLPFDRRSRDLVDCFVDEKALALPLKWRIARRIFVENQSDLFGEWVTDEQIDRVFAVAGMCDGGLRFTSNGNYNAPDHTMQILTKRAERMATYCLSRTEEWARTAEAVRIDKRDDASAIWTVRGIRRSWLGFSAEDQPNFDARWQHMRKLAEVGWFTWVSLEPLLGPINVRGALMEGVDPGQCANCGNGHGFMRCPNYGGIAARYVVNGQDVCSNFKRKNFGLHWGVVGGESGAGARPLELQWVKDLVAQFQAAAVPVFCKQIGSNPYWQGYALGRADRHDRKGGDMREWPIDIQVREFPKLKGATNVALRAVRPPRPFR